MLYGILISKFHKYIKLLKHRDIYILFILHSRAEFYYYSASILKAFHFTLLYIVNPLGWMLSSKYTAPPSNQCSLHISSLSWKYTRASTFQQILVTLSIAVLYLFYRFSWKVMLFLRSHNAKTEEDEVHALFIS